MGQYAERPYNIAVVGAASGIGRAAALTLAGEGARLICLDNSLSGARDTASAIAAAGGKASAYHLDVVEPPSVAATMTEVFGEIQQLHALVNCAGITGRTNIKAHEVDLDDFDLVYRVNLRGALLGFAGRAAAHAGTGVTAECCTSPPSPARKATQA